MAVKLKRREEAPLSPAPGSQNVHLSTNSAGGTTLAGSPSEALGTQAVSANVSRSSEEARQVCSTQQSVMAQEAAPSSESKAEQTQAPTFEPDATSVVTNPTSLPKPEFVHQEFGGDERSEAPTGEDDEPGETGSPDQATKKEKLKPPSCALPDIKPLGREKATPAEFPFEVLGTLLRNAIQGVQKVTQAPLSICAATVIAALCLAVQGFANVVTRSIEVPISLFILTIGESGERKSTVDRLVMESIQRLEEKYRQQYRAEIQAYEIEDAVYERQKREIVKMADPHERLSALGELGLPPERPLSPTLRLEDPTVEGLVKALAHSRPSVGIFSDEGGRFTGGYGMLKENQLKSGAFLSKLWDGRPIEMTRAGTGQQFVEGKRVCMHLMIQDGPGFEFLSNEGLANQGLFSRVLLSYPQSSVGTRKSVDFQLDADVRLGLFHSRMKEILATEPPLAEDTNNVLQPRKLPLHSDAEKLFYAFHDEIEAKMGAGGELSGIRHLVNKMPEQALRLAAVLTLFDDLSAPGVPVAKMEAAITVVRFYLGEALRISSVAVTDVKLQLAEKLLDWAKKRNACFSLVDVYQKGPVQIRSKQAAQEILAILIDHNLVRQKLTGQEIDGKYRREVFELVKD